MQGTLPSEVVQRRTEMLYGANMQCGHREPSVGSRQWAGVRGSTQKPRRVHLPNAAVTSGRMIQHRREQQRHKWQDTCGMALQDKG